MAPVLGTFFCLLVNCFLIFCSDLAVLIFKILLAGIESRHKVHRVGTYDFLKFIPLYTFSFERLREGGSIFKICPKVSEILQYRQQTHRQTLCHYNNMIINCFKVQHQSRAVFKLLEKVQNETHNLYRVDTLQKYKRFAVLKLC